MEYTANTGFMPCFAIPAAMVAAWPSAMPSSKKRSGSFRWNSWRPVPSSMAAVMTQMRLSFSARRRISSPNTVEKQVLAPGSAPFSGSKGPTE